jgi:hypothetical protein
MTNKKSNVAKGKASYDAQIGGELVAFFNKNITPYATEVGGPAFDLIPIEKQKDIMVNVARMHAEQEYNRIMDLVRVLQKQADDIKRRLYVTDAVHAAKYDFQIYHGQSYWLCFDTQINGTRLLSTGPYDWTTGAPDKYHYICQVKWLGDYTWQEVTTQMSDDNN